MGEYKGIWECVITFRRCDSRQGGVKDVSVHDLGEM